MRIRKAGRGGFTLVEIMMALVLLVVGALAMASLSVMVAQANRGSTDRTRAFQVMYDKIEEFQSGSYSSVGDGSDAVTVGDVSFTRSWTVEVNDPVSDVKRVDLTATWSDHDRTYAATTTAFVGVR